MVVFTYDKHCKLVFTAMFLSALTLILLSFLCSCLPLP